MKLHHSYVLATAVVLGLAISARIRCALIVLTFVLANVLCAHAQLRPEVTPKPKKPAPAKPAKPQAPKPQAEKLPEPAQIVIETSPSAEGYLDDQFAGRASPEGRLVIGNPKAGDHALRVSLPGKKDFARKVTVVAGQVTKLAAPLADLPGRILIHSSAGAEVFLDSARRGRTDGSGELAAADVAPGSHELRISAPGKKEYQQNVTVRVGQEATINAPLADLALTPGSVQVQVGESPVLGSPQAPLTMVEFTDYQCFFCRQFYLDSFGELKKNYIDTGKLRYVVRDFPLSFHADAMRAARAAHCAGAQGQYWPMRNALISNQSNLSQDALLGYAQGLKLDMSRFRTCLTSGNYVAEIQRSMEDAKSIPIAGTPSFILGESVPDGVAGAKIEGAQPYAVFEAKIKELLAKTQ